MRRSEGDTIIEAYVRFRFARLPWLKGAILPFGPLQPIKDWHPTAPELTSSRGLFQIRGEAGLTKFLKTGLGLSGHAAAPYAGV